MTEFFAFIGVATVLGLLWTVARACTRGFGDHMRVFRVLQLSDAQGQALSQCAHWFEATTGHRLTLPQRTTLGMLIRLVPESFAQVVAPGIMPTGAAVLLLEGAARESTGMPSGLFDLLSGWEHLRVTDELGLSFNESAALATMTHYHERASGTPMTFVQRRGLGMLLRQAPPGFDLLVVGGNLAPRDCACVVSCFAAIRAAAHPLEHAAIRRMDARTAATVAAAIIRIGASRRERGESWFLRTITDLDAGERPMEAAESSPVGVSR